MSHDNVGATGDSWTGQQQETYSNENRLQQADRESGSFSADCCEGDEREEKELASKVDAIIDAIPVEELRAIISSEVIARGEHWVGLLPDPDSFNKYPEFAQHQMVAWNDASIIDASKREDKLVDAAIRQAKVGQGLSFVLNLVFTVLSFAGFVVTGNLASFGFMSVPVISVGFNIWKDRQADKAKDTGRSE
ncbi:hypothetical protein VJ923_09680 [Adlercreutzia sp. R25]|uniref:hypothetical protein n=1 Tax=Adlercreutzia shanghongiae TaxID=3111773 RepID=UPI002DB75C18|nr:hypothetical protein [Adlercreutzia sp. R25]MEC4273425.1 hypothetical protein [Adlercreutzia sp. R25]